MGKEFEKQYAPQGQERKNYLEVADQQDQVRKFWEGKGNILVIDYSIFIHLSKQLGYDLKEARFFAIFEPVTNFKAGFKDASLRDRFNQAIASMCKNGKYAELLQRNGIGAKQSVCK